LLSLSLSLSLSLLTPLFSFIFSLIQADFPLERGPVPLAEQGPFGVYRTTQSAVSRLFSAIIRYLFPFHNIAKPAVQPARYKASLPEVSFPAGKQARLNFSKPIPAELQLRGKAYGQQTLHRQG
jgi:hypothetical protein